MGKLPILSSKVVKITQDIWLISLIQRRNLENYLIRKKNDIQEAIDWFPAISRSGLQSDTIYISFAKLLKALKGKVKIIPFNLIIHAAVEYSPNLAKNQSFFSQMPQVMPAILCECPRRVQAFRFPLTWTSQKMRLQLILRHQKTI
jgi:hypothetical protein